VPAEEVVVEAEGDDVGPVRRKSSSVGVGVDAWGAQQMWVAVVGEFIEEWVDRVA
jgi:hypothetical protein